MRHSPSRRRCAEPTRPRSRSSSRSCGNRYETTPVWRPRWVRGRENRLRRSPPGWPNLTGCGSFRRVGSGRCWQRCRCAGCGASVRSLRPPCAGWAWIPSALAHGVDDRPVAERGEAKQVSAETTFDADLSDMASVRAAVTAMTAHAHRRLLTSGQAARTVTVKVRSADVTHPAYGHGWVQGAGHGRVTVRFETRSTGPGPVHTFPTADPNLSRADPLTSLDW
jgi:hypothetical protein